MRFKLVSIACILAVIGHFSVVLADDVHANNNNNTKNIAILNYQIKTTKAEDLPKVQLQEIAAEKSSNKTDGITATNVNGEKTLRRKITPTNFNLSGLNTTTTNGTANDSVGVNVTTSKISNTIAIAENVILNITAPTTNNNATTITNVTTVEKTNTNITATETAVASTNATSSNNNNAALHSKTTQAAIVTKSTTAALLNVTQNATTPSTTSTSTTTTTTTTTSTTTTTTTTTTPKPKKPLITYGVEDFPDLDEKLPATQGDTASKLPAEPETAPIRETPNVQPSQELDTGFPYHNRRDYIVPIVAMLFTIPLAIGIVITTYRRFRDFWTTRHYRRMDFLVDGMYND